MPSVQSSSGTAPVITTEYKPFGVQLTFVPTVLASGIINLRLTPSVSELDYANAVAISGTLIPALTKREARTTIELRDGQSFAIAGLLQSDNLRDISQLPWLGSVPDSRDAVPQHDVPAERDRSRGDCHAASRCARGSGPGHGDAIRQTAAGQ